MNRNLLRKCAAAILASLLILPPGLPTRAWAAEPVSVDGLEAGADQVKIKLSAETRFDSFTTANPPRLVLELFDAEYKAADKTFAGKGKYLKGVRAAQFQRTPSLISRVVMDLNTMTTYHISQEKNVLTVALGDAEAQAPEAGGEEAADEAAADSSDEDSAPDEAPAAQAPAPAAKPAAQKLAAEKPAAAKPEAAKVAAEVEEQSTQASPELAKMAAQSDVSKDSEEVSPDEAAPASPAPERSKRRVMRGDILSRLPRDLVSLDFDNTDIKDVIKLLSAKAKINIIYGGDINGNLTLHLVDVPFSEAFRTILMMMNLSTSQVGDNILRVLTPAALAKAQTAAATATRVIPLNYSKAADMISAINQVRTAEGRTGTTLADAKTNSLIVTESLEGLAETERLVSQLDQRPKQVLIEVKLVEVTLSNSMDYGIQWDYQSVENSRLNGQQGTNMVGTIIPPAAGSGATRPPLDQNSNATVGVGAGGRGTGVTLPSGAVAGALTLGRVTNNYFLSATLTAAASQGKVKVLSDPKVATLNNQPANINVTTSIPYVTSNVASTGVTSQQVQYIVTGIQLTVTPSINVDGRITLDVSPKVSQPSATSAASTNVAPAVDSRDAKTTVLVKDGETIVIGGLISDSVSNQETKVPILGDIPFIGWLFKKKSISRNRTELLIFVTPKIMPD